MFGRVNGRKGSRRKVEQKSLQSDGSWLGDRDKYQDRSTHSNHSDIHGGTRGGITKKIAMVFVGVVALFIVGFTVISTLMSPKDQSSANGSITKQQAFDITERSNNSIAAESVNVNVQGNSWTLTSYNLPYSDQRERDAAAAAAEASQRAAVLSAASVQSYFAVVNQDAPANAPGSAAPEAPGNTYGRGTCTWYAYNRRYQIGRPAGRFWGNGGYWHVSAANDGVPVDHTPEVGAIFEQAGHVGVVEAIGENDTVYISEMNYNWVLYRYNERWVSNASGYWYIH
jgi:surface antigen